MKAYFRTSHHTLINFFALEDQVSQRQKNNPHDYAMVKLPYKFQRQDLSVLSQVIRGDYDGYRVPESRDSVYG